MTKLTCDCISYNQPQSWQKTQNVELRVGDYEPPEWSEVPEHMREYSREIQAQEEWKNRIILVDA